MEQNVLLDDKIIHQGKIKLLDLKPDVEIPVDLTGVVNKSKPPRLYFKILPTIPRDVMRDWHLRDHTLYISLEYDQKADALRKPPAYLELVSVDSIQHRIRIFGGTRKPESWIKYPKKPVFLSENGPTNVFRICTKRAPKQAFIPLVNVTRHIEGNMHIKFWACSKESKDHDYRKLKLENLYPQLILDDVIEIDGPGKYSAGHVYMQESKRPPKFIKFTPRQLAFRESLIDFAKHFGPMVFESYLSWQVDFLDNEIV
ncbi:hypothetical protein TVAG_483020 [Trichomonas vaginalis G3]|uniref:Uncharacterized protein n=1 Tax=Trichomonas vaginalis (strain ATCC PRA-98 / G3) TaxID=412133 RepID=A2FAK2_TRIV3|nr:hypothetical protein TVAGG3_0187620 [Trichomonas vaginalis G3]EAX98045.1 hypothetical protein TVAG_483020 [Trichomonas vaginalis G3]KAI5549750.1 hypothetical protein TVAGG3_0187620 [Trichomonas vaginalis G3]|eukprot:XP_001310975.1 hypothetical protein [Trichomonas vaginalis G3]